MAWVDKRMDLIRMEIAKGEDKLRGRERQLRKTQEHSSAPTPHTTRPGKPETTVRQAPLPTVNLESAEATIRQAPLPSPFQRP